MEIHFSKKDFKIDWFSGTGGGGQYRNKHQNCCRITHIETGLRAQETRHRDRPANQKSAFGKLAKLLIAHFRTPDVVRRTFAETIRSYHKERNEVLDKASRLRMPYSVVVEGRDIGPMIEARKSAVSGAYIQSRL